MLGIVASGPSIVKDIFYRGVTMHGAGALRFAYMAPRSPKVAPWGQRLRDLRGKRSGGWVIQRLASAGISFTDSTLSQYERGTVIAPDPVVLWGLAQIYGVEVGQLIETLAQNRRQPDLTELPPAQPGAVLLEADEREVLERLRMLPTDERKLYLDFIGYRHACGMPNGPPREEVPSQPNRAASRPRGRR